MVTLIVSIAICSTFILCLTWPIGAGGFLEWEQDKPVTWQLHISLFSGLIRMRFNRIPKIMQKKVKAKVKIKEQLVRPALGRPVFNISFLKSVLHKTSPLFKRSIRCFKFGEIDVHLMGGSYDCAYTGIWAGWFWGIAPIVSQWLRICPPFKLTKISYGFTPIFWQATYGVKVRYCVTLYPFLVLILGVKSWILYRRLKKMEVVK